MNPHKFKEGDVVKHMGKKCRVDSCSDKWFYGLVGIEEPHQGQWLGYISETDIDLLKKPKFRVNDKVMVIEQMRAIYPKIMTITRVGFVDNRFVYRVYGIDKVFHQDNLEPVSEPDTDIEKLDLTELLKGYEGEVFYSLFHGNITLDEVRTGDKAENPSFLIFYSEGRNGGSIILRPDGKAMNDGSVVLYPSRTLYEEYPLNPHKAWSKWLEKHQLWVPKDMDTYWYINSLMNPVSKVFDKDDIEDQARIANRNRFRTFGIAQQAAIRVRKCLEAIRNQ